MGALAIVGALCLVFSPISLQNITEPSVNSYKIPFLGVCFSLIIVQTAILFLFILFFYSLEHLTLLNPRLSYMEPGKFLQKCQEDPLMLGFLPWLAYGVLGVGVAYFSICKGRTPYLPKVILPRATEHPKLFFYNLLSICCDVVAIVPFLLVVSTSIIWICEAVNSILHWESLFQVPVRSIFITALLFLSLRKTANIALTAMMEKRVPLGGLLAFYVLFYSFFILWLHTFGSQFSFGREETDPTLVLKTQLLDALSPENREMRFTLLVWGWWSIWIPWMVSFIARVSIGRRVWQALIASMIVPGIFFLYIIPRVNFGHWRELCIWLQIPSVQFFIGMCLILFMMIIWGKMHHAGDIGRGAMLKIGKWRARSINQWLRTLFNQVSTYITALFLIAWFPAQGICTIAAGLMTIVVAFFVFTLVFHLVKKMRSLNYSQSQSESRLSDPKLIND